MLCCSCTLRLFKCFVSWLCVLAVNACAELSLGLCAAADLRLLVCGWFLFKGPRLDASACFGLLASQTGQPSHGYLCACKIGIILAVLSKRVVQFCPGPFVVFSLHACSPDACLMPVCLPGLVCTCLCCMYEVHLPVTCDRLCCCWGRLCNLALADTRVALRRRHCC